MNEQTEVMAWAFALMLFALAAAFAIRAGLLTLG